MSLTTVALVDDHILLRSSLASLISTFEGYRVILEADNGQDFTSHMQLEEKPEIVLLDITMPIMNGYETASWIRNNIPETKILVLSMLDNDAAIIRMLKYGAKGYILKDSKPFEFKKALDIVKRNEFYLNELVSNKMIRYIENEKKFGNIKNIANIQISEREMDFLKWACTEKSYKEIATEMYVSPRTIDSYRDSLFEKLEVNTRVGLVIFAIKNGIVMI